MEDKVKVTFLTGVKAFPSLEYFARDVSGIPAAVLLGLHAADIGRVRQDISLPVGILECRSGGQVLSRLSVE